MNLLLVLYEREEGPFQENEPGAVLVERVPELTGRALRHRLEPTDGAVQVGCVGTLHATVTFEGQAAHSARPWQGENAIHAAGALLTELAATARRARRSSAGHTFHEVLSATLAKGGRARNVVAEALRAQPELPLRARQVAQPGAPAGARTTFVAGATAPRWPSSTSRPAAPASAATTRWFQRLRAAQRRRRRGQAGLDRRGPPGGARGAAVNFGPGDTAQAHQRGEWIEVAALARGYRLLERFLRS